MYAVIDQVRPAKKTGALHLCREYVLKSVDVQSHRPPSLRGSYTPDKARFRLISISQQIVKITPKKETSITYDFPGNVVIVDEIKKIKNESTESNSTRLNRIKS
uniref:Uncharacterized protein n=1 Tax=Sipha flava TaxID=143950 RepID=A0A2S2QQ81_9HEMI